MAAPNIVRNDAISFSHLSLIQLTLTPVAAVAQTSVEQTFPLAGLSMGDGMINGQDQVVAIRKANVQSGLTMKARVVSEGILGIQFSNPTIANITPTPAEVYTIVLWRPSMMPAATATLV